MLSGRRLAAGALLLTALAHTAAGALRSPPFFALIAQKERWRAVLRRDAVQLGERVGGAVWAAVFRAVCAAVGRLQRPAVGRLLVSTSESSCS